MTQRRTIMILLSTARRWSVALLHSVFVCLYEADERLPASLDVCVRTLGVFLCPSLTRKSRTLPFRSVRIVVVVYLLSVLFLL